MIAIDWSKQQAVDADPRAIQQIDFAANLQCQSKYFGTLQCFSTDLINPSKTKRDI